MNKKNGFFVAVLALCLIGFFLYRKKKITPVETVAQSEVENQGKMVSSVTASSAPVPGALDPSQQNRLIARGVRILQLQKKTLSVTFEKHIQWCSLGDLDLMKMNSKSASEKEWLITVTNGVESKALPISLVDIIEGKSLQLSMPEKDGVYGFYLCKNSLAKCPQQKAWSPQASKAKKGEGFLVSVQVLARKAEQILVLPTNRWDNRSIGSLKGLLSGMDFTETKRVDTLFAAVSQVKPLGARVDNRGLIVPLNMNDPKCVR